MVKRWGEEKRKGNEMRLLGNAYMASLELRDLSAKDVIRNNVK
jgi:hypothetical protein